MSGCGAIDHLTGGTIKESTIASSTVMASTIRDSTLENLIGVDAASAERIADAIAVLPPDKLEALADAIAKAMSATEAEVGRSPKVSTDGVLPTTLYGGRDGLLGTPEEWLIFQGKVVPVYKEGPKGE